MVERQQGADENSHADEVDEQFPLAEFGRCPQVVVHDGGGQARGADLRVPRVFPAGSRKPACSGVRGTMNQAAGVVTWRVVARPGSLAYRAGRRWRGWPALRAGGP